MKGLKSLLPVVGVLVLALISVAVAYASSSTTSGGNVTLGIIGFCKADVTGNAVTAEMQRQAEKLGWDVDYQDANPCGSDAAANSIMKVMALKDTTLIVTIAFDPRKLGAGLAAARKANIPVLAHAGETIAPGVVWATSLGYVAKMGQKVEADFGGAGKAKGEILNLTFHGATPGVNRDRLIQDVAKKNPGLHLTNKEIKIPGQVLSGRDFTTAWLAANPQKPGVKLGIYAIFDDPARGAVAALKRAGRRDVKVYSYDATPAGLALVKQGWIVADNGNPPLAQAAQTMKAVQQVVNGTIGEPRVVPAAAVLVTKANVAQYEKQYGS